MEIIRTNTPTQDAGKRLTEVLRAHQKTPILLLLSGGSAFSILPYAMSAPLDELLTISVLDERFTHDPAGQNFTQLQTTTFGNDALQKGARMIDLTIKQEDSRESVAERFAQALRDWSAAHPDGVIVATMGIGTDGHTAGIMPHVEEVDFDGAEWVVDYTTPLGANPFPERITVTHTFLSTMVNHAIVYAIGDEKQPYVSALEDGDGDRQEMPAYILRSMRDVVLYTTA